MAKAADNISKAAAKAPARMSKKDSLTKEQLRAASGISSPATPGMPWPPR